MHNEPTREVRRRKRTRRCKRTTMAQRRAALLARIGMSEEEAQHADGGRIVSAMVAARAHIVSAEEETRRTPAGTPKALGWLASDAALISGRTVTTAVLRRWLAANLPGVLAARLAYWDTSSTYHAAEDRRGSWDSPDVRIARWERRRDSGRGAHE